MSIENPSPCMVLKPGRGYALLPSRNGSRNFLLVAYKRLLNSDESALTRKKSVIFPIGMEDAWDIAAGLAKPISDAAIWSRRILKNPKDSGNKTPRL
ncbi:hypothetical protein [Xanthomonas cassavae]|uniref:hypothetical protein n=1 Tax=Xanthomonas cassavae TaxID=56450 RepID=UPI003CCCBDC4